MPIMRERRYRDLGPRGNDAFFSNLGLSVLGRSEVICEWVDSTGTVQRD
jgi:hypothetical protein